MKDRKTKLGTWKMEILETMVKNENSKKKLSSWQKTMVQQLQSMMRQLKRSMTESLGWRERKNKEYSLLNDCKFSKTKLPKLVITKFDSTHLD